MAVVLKICLVLCCFVSVGSFIGVLAATWILPFYLNDGKSVWFISLSRHRMLDPFRPMPATLTRTGREFWRIRDICFKVFLVTAGIMVVIAIIAAIADVKL